MKREGDLALEANRDVADIARHVRYDRLHNEVYETPSAACGRNR